MKITITILFLLSSLVSCKEQAKEQVKEQLIKVDVATFKEKISKSNVQLVDVRTPKEYEQGHIENAILIDYFSENFKEQFQKLDKDKAIYIYCRSGNRSGKSSKILVDLGFTEIIDLIGGYKAWSPQ